MMARALKLDPIEFRRNNILRDGRPQATGTPMQDAAIEAVLDRLATRMNWGKAFDRGSGTLRRGRGIAIGFKASISPTTSIAIVNVAADGSVTLYCSTVDMGQGSDTANAQLVAEVLDITAEAVTVVHPDTDVTPYDMATLGSRSMFHMGNAVRLAAQDARDKLAALARELGLPEGSNVPVAELFQKKYKMQAGNIIGIGSYIPAYAPPDHGTGQTPNATPFWMVGATGAEVEVDTETGHVRVTRLVNVADVGRAINPRIVETQLSGAAIMQLGFTMQEKMEFDGGQVTNASLADYKIPSILDIPPDMDNEVVEAEQHSGPFGAKGVGESGTFGVSPAIANAIDDAVGVRLTCAAAHGRDGLPGAARRARTSRWRTSDEPHHSLHPQRRRRSRPTSRRTRIWSRCCSSASICSARARAARRGCAAAARCWSTAAPCRAVCFSRRSSTATTVVDDRAPGGRRQTRPGAGGLHRVRRVPVRLLHAGLHPDGRAAPRRASRPRRRRDPPLSLRQSLSLRGLSGNHPGRKGRRAETPGRQRALIVRLRHARSALSSMIWSEKPDPLFGIMLWEEDRPCPARPQRIRAPGTAALDQQPMEHADRHQSRLAVRRL